MAVCVAECSCNSAIGARESDTVALQRFTELLKQQEQLIELLRVYTPEQMITHLKNCTSAPWHRLKVLDEGELPEKSALLDGMKQTYTLEELVDSFRIFALAKQYGCSYNNVASALRLRQQQNESKARYYAKRKGDLNRKSADKVSALRRGGGRAQPTKEETSGKTRQNST